MDVFFDTEFTTSENHIGYPGLISIACVAKDGSEFYAELSNTWQIGNCSPWVIENVLPLLDGGDFKMLDGTGLGWKSYFNFLDAGQTICGGAAEQFRFEMNLMNVDSKMH